MMSSHKRTFSVIIFPFLISTIYWWSPCQGVGIHHKEDSEWCYSDPECGPDSEHWGEICQNGFRQSPISLPAKAHILSGFFALDLHSYRADSFRMRNNGHTVHLEFLESHGHSGPNRLKPGQPFGTQFAFPHPVGKGGWDKRAYYKFDSAHFHWGVRDDVGSEHCFEDRCFSMELHLVHHLSTYDNMEDALDSKDPNALAVIAVMLDATPAAGPGNQVLSPIVNNIFQIEEPAHEDWTYVNHPLDFTPLLVTKGQNYMYSYKGSLTTPDCEEQVNWFVFKRPIAIAHRDVNAFRFIKSNQGDELRENHRPIQSRNGRPVFLTAVKAA